MALSASCLTRANYVAYSRPGSLGCIFAASHGPSHLLRKRNPLDTVQFREDGICYVGRAKVLQGSNGLSRPKSGSAQGVLVLPSLGRAMAVDSADHSGAEIANHIGGIRAQPIRELAFRPCAPHVAYPIFAELYGN
jgi:hypothetical protein